MSIHFTLPESSEATEPPEERGLHRDDVRLPADLAVVDRELDRHPAPAGGEERRHHDHRQFRIQFLRGT